MITICNLEGASDYRVTDGYTVMIRVGDPKTVFGGIDEKVVDVLEIRFHDYTDEEFTDLNLWHSSFRLMSEEQATEVACFLRRYRSCDVVIHCVEGRSRSVGIAKAWATYTGQEDVLRHIEETKRYRPNRWVYDLVLAALNKEEGLD